VKNCIPLGVAASLLLASCTGAQIEANRIATTLKETKTEKDACIRNITNNPQYEQILTKIYLGVDGDGPPLEMQTDKSIPTRAETEKLYKVHAEIKSCRKISVDGLSKMNASASSVALEGYAESDRLWVQLVGGKISYGEFNTGIQGNKLRTGQRLNQVGQQIANRLETQNEAELAARREAAATASQYLLQQQQLENDRVAAINAANRTVMTNCNNFGATTNCISH
jgi:hypothetical protein